MRILMAATCDFSSRHRRSCHALPMVRLHHVDGAAPIFALVAPIACLMAYSSPLLEDIFTLLIESRGCSPGFGWVISMSWGRACCDDFLLTHLSYPPFDSSESEES
jgi:hypothetical protein